MNIESFYKARYDFAAHMAYKVKVPPPIHEIAFRKIPLRVRCAVVFVKLPDIFMLQQGLQQPYLPPERAPRPDLKSRKIADKKNNGKVKNSGVQGTGPASYRRETQKWRSYNRKDKHDENKKLKRPLVSPGYVIGVTGGNPVLFDQRVYGTFIEGQ